MEKLLVTGALALFGFNVQAGTVLYCNNGDAKLQVQTTDQGYVFVFESLNYNRVGKIERDMVNGIPAMTFKGEDVGIVHLYGEYSYFSKDGHAGFPDEGCVLNRF